MQRIAIIGNAGGGKSVLARKLRDMLGIPVFTFDDLQWRPGWTRSPEEEIHAEHSRWMAEPRWIIDGWGNWEILDQRFDLADTIIFIDFHIAVHYWWAIKRQLKAALNLSQGWPPEGCPALPVTMRLFKLMWKIHREIHPQLTEFVHRHSKNTKIIHMKSPRSMKLFMTQVTNRHP